MNPLSGLFSQAWGMYTTHARHLLAIAFAVYVVAAVIEAVLGLLGVVGLLLAAIVGVVASFLLQAALVKAVDDVRDGRVDMSLAETLRAARPAVGRVAGASILASLAIVVGLILLIVPGLYLITIWCLIAPVLVLEGATIGSSFGRSRELVRGYGWQVFVTIVLVYIILIVANLVIAILLSWLPGVLANGISELVSGTLVAPFLAVVVTLAYFRLRQAHLSITGHP